MLKALYPILHRREREIRKGQIEIVLCKCVCFIIVYHNTCVVVNMKNDCIDFLGNNGLFFQVRSEPMSIKYGCQLSECKEQSNSSGRIEGVVNLFFHHIFA